MQIHDSTADKKAKTSFISFILRDFSTTANIYAHMDPRAKISSAEAMVRGLGLEDSDEKD